MSRGWLAQRERSNLPALRFLVWASRAFGRGFGRALLVPVTIYFLAFSPRARRASRDYLRRALGRRPRVREQFRHYYAFATVSLDRVFFLQERKDLFEIELNGEDALDEVIAAGRGCLVIGAHLGSFEAPRLLGRRRGIQLRLAMYQDNARMMKTVIDAVNPALSQEVIELGQPDSMLRLREHIERGGWVGVLADRTINDTDERRVPFLGGDAAFPVAPFRIGAMLGCPMLLMAGLYHGGNRYELCFERLECAERGDRGGRNAAVEACIRNYAARLEHHCRRAPYNWFNFYDFWSDPHPRG